MTPDPKTLLRWSRRILLLTSLVLMVIFLQRYGTERVPEGIRDLGAHAPPGSLLVLGVLRESTPLHVGSLIEVEAFVDEQRYRYFSRVTGLPGETIHLRADAAGGDPFLVVGGRETMVRVPAGSPLQAGEIPEEHYLLLDPDLEASGTDSRRLGLIPRERILRKILVTLTP